MNYREGKTLAETVNTEGVVRVRTSIKTGIRTAKLVVIAVAGLILSTVVIADVKEWWNTPPSPPAPVTAAATPFRCPESGARTADRCPLTDKQWILVTPVAGLDAERYDLCLSFSGPLVEWQRVGNVLKLRAKPGASGQVAAYQWLPHPASCPSLI